MGDFFLSLDCSANRGASNAAELLRFRDYTEAFVFDEALFSMVVTCTEGAALWAPYRAADGATVAVAGRVAMDEPQWALGESVAGRGGLAGKALYAIYQKDGLAGVEAIGGNRVILIHDVSKQLLHLVNDAAGAFPAFRLDSAERLIFCSHPDVLAAVAGEQQNLDEISLAEFLLASTVTPPATYYRRIRALPHGTTTSIALTSRPPVEIQARRYFDISWRPQPDQDEDDLADELAQAFRTSVRRRTLPRLGRTAVALSGGLDSRALLACVENKENVFAFCCYNEPNRELATAQAIAKALQIPFLPWQREFEYYGNQAEQGVRISGGMGTFANNHFLGVVPRLRAEGAQNLLTGCYCDYLFKALPLNRSTHWLTGRERLAPFRHQFYFDHFERAVPFGLQLRDRWESRVPLEFQNHNSDESLFQIEARRTFPFCYEGDNQQRLVPQRVSGWYLPVADRAVLDIYRKIPSRLKLNRSVFTRAVGRLCQGSLARVPDANTGALVGAPAISETLHHHWSRARRKLRRRTQSIGTDGSWPDWYSYVAQSGQLRALWQRPNPAANDFFQRVLPAGDMRPDTAAYAGHDIWLLVPILTLKLWFEQWHS
ncbi:MAG TPA: asparagine synthase-related protein [Verrucomicrobiae bacterium]|nr:asparagine synthase-related protein [Verrucomicrobiae bacterium]